jgi:hypothetical protein
MCEKLRCPIWEVGRSGAFGYGRQELRGDFGFGQGLRERAVFRKLGITNPHEPMKMARFLKKRKRVEAASSPTE